MSGDFFDTNVPLCVVGSLPRRVLLAPAAETMDGGEIEHRTPNPAGLTAPFVKLQATPKQSRWLVSTHFSGSPALRRPSNKGGKFGA